MAKGFKHGTSGKKENPLNFAVVAYPSEVELNTATPEDTTITTLGVVTTNPITGWYFTYEQPENMAEGEVWFNSGTASAVKFNALKKNNVTVYPMSAKQMVSGALKDVTAKSYQNGEWVDWVTYLYNNGDECVELTGGWTTSGFSYRELRLKPEKFSKSSDCLIFEETGASATVCVAGCQNQIDLTDVKEISITYENTVVKPTTEQVGIIVDISSSKDMSASDVVNLFTYGAAGKKTETFPVDTLDGKYYIGIHSASASGGKVYSIHLVK